ncbi:MAG: UDP-N-acetylenolpyruvoylglucosamine reductase [Phototrophicales bacterium]|nr:MAG: UDP-N-acetylenolpyruvoylglucosamine reductase [Phototrophicales bacterium]
MTLEQIPDLEISYDINLAKYTAARLGGVADLVAIAHTTQALLQAAYWAHQHKIAWYIVGGGSNILVADRGIRGLVILNKSRQVHIDAETGQVTADSGVGLATLARRCMANGLKGMEWCVSVPGTLGGAVVNNAGAHGSDMASHLVSAQIVDFTYSSTPTTWPCEAMQYAYRYSALKGQHQRYIVLSATLQLEAGHVPEELNKIANEFITHRKRTQPPGASLGSMFKNPEGDYAGRLIEAAGLKGYRIGGVEVSRVHANFFVNVDNATAEDYAQLIAHVQKTVYEKFGVHLELEIELIGEYSPT